MPRPERPVEGSGPVPDLARELRRIRDRAGTPGYREMADKARFSRETLSAAARGAECPTWEVAKAFADACDPTGTAARRLRQMWEVANKKAVRRRTAARRRPGASAPRPAGAGRPVQAARPPWPDPGGTPAQYVYMLRALRAWAGNPGRRETRQRLGTWRSLPKSTMYDALSPRRVTLPPLNSVRSILLTCLDDEGAVEEWVSAWQAISFREFTRANPAPAAELADGGRAAGGIGPVGHQGESAQPTAETESATAATLRHPETVGAGGRTVSTLTDG